MKDLKLIVYSHSDVEDVLYPCVKRLEKYGWKNFCIFYDKKEAIENAKVFSYDDSFKYCDRVCSCLERMKEDLVLFTHEDFILYDKPDYEKLESYVKKLKNSDRDFVRLITTGETEGKRDGSLKEMPNDSDYIFAIQPTIWKRKSLLEVYSKGASHSIWSFEVNANKYCANNNITGWYHFDDKNKRGSLHWDSTVFPYIATAVVKGKWNQREYSKEIGDIFQEYSMKDTRGSI
tara:strand:- start:8481 stop:9179 length:699 start_codon:yes stop_codon:yes gene_type:complete